MTHDIYVFGSICRGQVTSTSDADILVLTVDKSQDKYPEGWSIYNKKTVSEYYQQGKLFAWHLHLEAKCVYHSGSIPFLEEFGKPSPYTTMMKDIDDLEILLDDALHEIANGTESLVYELGIAYTAIRDIAMSASWKSLKSPCFSSDAPYKLSQICPLDRRAYDTAMLARHSSTRGTNICSDLDSAANELLNSPLNSWIRQLRLE